MAWDREDERPAMLLRDNDTKFTKQFDPILTSEGIDVRNVGPLAPNMNAHAGRFVQSIKQECLDHFVVLGEGHLRRIVREYVEYYQEEWPHQGLANKSLGGADAAR